MPAGARASSRPRSRATTGSPSPRTRNWSSTTIGAGSGTKPWRGGPGISDGSALAHRTDEIPLADAKAAVAENRVGRRHVEKEVRQREVQQIGLPLETDGLAADGQSDRAVLRSESVV